MTLEQEAQRSDVAALAPYSLRLSMLIDEISDERRDARLDERIHDAINGGASRALRQVVSIEILRKNGLFFTAQELATRALSRLLPTINEESVVVDPASGAGDLLLQCARPLLRNPGQERIRIIAQDRHRELLDILRSRLILALMNDGSTSAEAHALIRQVRCSVGDFLKNPHDLGSVATHFVLNPPYVLAHPPSSVEWAKGRVNLAGVFLEHCVISARPGTRIAAILPDVLRSGSRYEKWRRRMARLMRIERVELAGRFAAEADVDVFLLDAVVGESSSDQWLEFQLDTPHASTVGDYFDVCVGPVVNYRDPESGPSHPFFQARDLPVGKTVWNSKLCRRYAGRVLGRPLVVVRRTSRPGDGSRALGTIIGGNGAVAVENHLLCLIPKSGGMVRCKQLLRILSDPRTTNWLNHRICCRHLTVAALADLPWWLSD